MLNLLVLSYNLTEATNTTEGLIFTSLENLWSLQLLKGNFKFLRKTTKQISYLVISVFLICCNILQ